MSPQCKPPEGAEDGPPNFSSDLISRTEVIRILTRLADIEAETALYGETLNKRQREASNAALMQARCCVALMPPAPRSEYEANLMPTATSLVYAGFKARGWYGPNPLKDMAEHAAQILDSHRMLASPTAPSELARLRTTIEGQALTLQDSSAALAMVTKERDAAREDNARLRGDLGCARQDAETAIGNEQMAIERCAQEAEFYGDETVPSRIRALKAGGVDR